MARPAPHLRRAATARFATPVAGSVLPEPPAGLGPQPSELVTTVVGTRAPLPFTVTPPAPVFVLAESTVEDFDQLWDWARSDRDGVTNFLQHSHANSQSFFGQIGVIVSEESQQRAWLRSVRRGDDLCGFVMLKPIIKTPVYSGTLHLYLTGNTPADAVTDVIEQLPPQMTLMMVAANEDVARQFVSLGFQSKIVLTRPASSAAVSHDRV